MKAALTKRLMPELTGDISGLTGDTELLYGHCDGLWGNVGKLWGDISGLKGDCTGVVGCTTKISGNLDECELTLENRVRWAHIENLIGETIIGGRG
jgi:hypothetical protein